MAETNTSNIGDIEWVPFRFRDLEDGELFWATNERTEENGPIRKINDTTALILRSQKEVNVDTNPIVYQKEY
jgi:hypothetical protein